MDHALAGSYSDARLLTLAGALGRPKYQPTPSILWQAPANCRCVSGFQLMPDPDVGEVPEKRPKCLTPGRIPA